MRSDFFIFFHLRMSSLLRPQPTQTSSRILHLDVQGFSTSLDKAQPSIVWPAPWPQDHLHFASTTWHVLGVPPERLA